MLRRLLSIHSSLKLRCRWYRLTNLDSTKDFWANPYKFKGGDYVVLEGEFQGFTNGKVYKVLSYQRKQTGVNTNKRYIRLIDDKGIKNGLAPGWFRPATPTELVLYTTKE